ncbi:MAG: hypothetical protein IE933_11250 [Sphingomonadales bacterium]|nr:hypothetical protein [Sphingomonadales bacterium]MBD3774442.1 hypothetical protein [Paracoccaceae bacterium]
MRRLAGILSVPSALLTALTLCAPTQVLAREAVDASAPQSLSVTFYRDPERGAEEKMDADWPRGFAMISETRTVTLPPGESTIRFTGVAEGMVAVTAIVTGLPGGTIEKNRNAELLSPAALVDGTLGNRVTVTRTNPATGAATSESAVIRTRADGGLVLQTREGFEAVRCSGIPEKLTFDRIPAGLSPQPVFSIDTRDASGGTYRVTLTYLAWGFDWQAHYVATLSDAAKRGKVGLRLMSWLTLLNDNGQSFPDAQLLAVAGKLNVESDYGDLADPPVAAPLRLTCYPLGSTAAGSPIPYYDAYAPPLPPPPPAPMMAEAIIVTGSARARGFADSAPALMATEEQLGDLKLYRVPEPVTVNAKGLKQVAFLDKPEVTGEFLYRIGCDYYGAFNGETGPSQILFATKNDEAHGLGAALPSGGFTLFEPSAHGDLLVGEQVLRDYAVGQDVELVLGQSHQVMGTCAWEESSPEIGNDERRWSKISVLLTNANRNKATVRLTLGEPGRYEIKGLGGTRVKDGQYIADVVVPAGGERRFSWQLREIATDD